jgi:type IV secretory pathway VirB3-like protein
MSLATRVEIPSGLVYPRMLLWIPLEALGALAVLVAVPFIVFKTLWTLLLAVPVWSFLRWHSKKNPYFLRVWAGQLVFTTFYRHG